MPAGVIVLRSLVFRNSLELENAVMENCVETFRIVGWRCPVGSARSGWRKQFVCCIGSTASCANRCE